MILNANCKINIGLDVLRRRTDGYHDLETVMIPLMANDLFGSASYSKVLGIFMAMNSLGLCLGSPLGELLRKITGDYRFCFWFFSIVLVFVFIGFQYVLRCAQKQKDAILATENT